MADARERWKEAGGNEEEEGGRAGRGGCSFFWGGGRLFLSRAEINHGAEAIMCNSSPARLVTLVT